MMDLPFETTKVRLFLKLRKNVMKEEKIKKLEN